MSQLYLICILLCGIGYIGSCVDIEDIGANSNELEESTPLKWLKGAQNIFASPTGHVVVQVAKELINRSAGNSQVLSLNLTNLFIILLLKVLIFSAGLLGAGHWSNYGYARSSDSGFTFFLNDDEAYLITGFLAAQSGIDDCLYAAACAAPNVAYEYAKAAKALVDSISKYNGFEFTNTRYIELIVLVEEAAYNGYRGIPCNTTTTCDGLY
ncbi:uncharacterized protein LOC119615986 [Lucilia sericata]|uniref:uncharacterized protein LOC119615986 n=1 Tax=Lucilia sericata TaxID=13632 RepID=UPI0018A853A7|nr:uncharacterized protein LOC119615986 [Lucilia sericata]